MKKNIIIIMFIAIFLAGCTNTNVGLIDQDSPLFIDACSFDFIEGTDCLVLSSHNPDVDNSGSKEDLWEGGGLMTYLTVAQKYNISSTSIQDNSTGTGLRLLFVRGLDENYTVQTEIITMDGLTVVQTVNEYIRPMFIAGVSGGSEETNLGIITATSANTGDLQIQMDVDEAISKNSQFTVPDGEVMIIKKIMIGATKSGGQSPIVQVKGRVRFFGTNIWIETFDFKLDTSVNDILIIDQPISNMLVSRSDFRLEVTTSTDNVDVTARTWMIFRPNE